MKRQMNTGQWNGRAALGLVMGLALLMAAPGCATKKFVQRQLNPVDQRVRTLETASSEQAKDLDEHERLISLADERAITADEKAIAARKAADGARKDANRAGDRATEVQSDAEMALIGLDSMEGRIDRLSDYEVASEDTILFEFESSRLSAEAMHELDLVAERLAVRAPFKVEVRGFTDSSGSRFYNLALSEKRAKAVVLYLAGEHDVPLHRIHMLGFGSEQPDGDNDSRDGRKANRRVEVTVYVADDEVALSALQNDLY